MLCWDEEKRQRNLFKHGIDFSDLEGFFEGALLTREDQRADYGETRFQSIGVFYGIPLFVVWTPSDDSSCEVRIISARKAVRHERNAWVSYYGAD